MGTVLEIPKDISRSMKVPEKELPQRLKLELAYALGYRVGILNYLQEICYHVFEEAQETIDEDAYELGFEKAFSDISLLVLQDKAAKISEAESKIVRSMKAKRYYSISQLSESCNIKKSSLNTYLRRLKQKGILFQDRVGEYKGQYIQRDPLLEMYLDTL